MGLETGFQDSVLRYLNSLPECVAENVSGNANQSGRPDINGCFCGRMFKLELKTPDNKYQASKKQQLNLRRWKRAGCVTGVVYSMETVQELFSLDWEEAAGEFKFQEDNSCISWFHIPDWS